MNFNRIIDQLKQTRPVFHSEDDLKLAMAIVIKELYPSYEIRLEKPIQIRMKIKDDYVLARAPIDIVVLDSKHKIAYPIEIKYKTKKVDVVVGDESYSLANHGANDVGRYSFRKDIYRVENVDIENFSINQGFVFILTNDRGYYQNDVSKKNSLDVHFSFHHGMTLKAEYVGWNYKRLPENKYYYNDTFPLDNSLKKHWTAGKEYVYKLDLKSDYYIEWNNYSVLIVNDSKDVHFKYCLIEVNR